MKQQLTVIGRDEGNEEYEPILIYQLEADPNDEAAVFTAFVQCREADLGRLSDPEKDRISLLFAFAGDLSPVADWRN